MPPSESLAPYTNTRVKVPAFVPYYYAMSGGTLIALAADEIVMSEYAVLGPVAPKGGFRLRRFRKRWGKKPVEKSMMKL